MFSSSDEIDNEIAPVVLDGTSEDLLVGRDVRDSLHLSKSVNRGSDGEVCDSRHSRGFEGSSVGGGLAGDSSAGGAKRTRTGTSQSRSRSDLSREGNEDSQSDPDSTNLGSKDIPTVESLSSDSGGVETLEVDLRGEKNEVEKSASFHATTRERTAKTHESTVLVRQNPHTLHRSIHREDRKQLGGRR